MAVKKYVTGKLQGYETTRAKVVNIKTNLTLNIGKNTVDISKLEAKDCE